MSPGTKFDGEAIVSGGAVYLGADGFAAIICTPPPIGMAGTASYDAKKRMLTLKLKDNSSPPQRQTVTIIYDPNAQTLTSKPAQDVIKENLKRRKDKIPKWVIEETK